MNEQSETKNKISPKDMVVLIAIGIAAGAMFLLPYLKDTYYVSLMEGLGITDTQMGGMLSMYALAFLVIGIPCGYLADRFPTKTMLILILALTAIGGAWYFTLPSYASCLVIFCLWSFTTTMYWPIMNKVSKQMGESHVKAYGYIESTRAATYGVSGFLSVALFTYLGEGQIGIKGVIALYTCVLIVMTILTFLLLEKSEPVAKKDILSIKESFKQIFHLTSNRSIWLLGLIVFSTLCCYSCSGMIVPYLEKICGLSPQFAASFGILRMSILMTIAGVASGVISGKLGSVTKLMYIAYTVIALSGTVLAFIAGATAITTIFIIISVVAIFAMGLNKTMYMAPFSELNIPASHIGMAASLVSMIGFSCELFIYTLIGNIVQSNEGAIGYKYVFFMMVGFAVAGFIFTMFLRNYIKKHPKAITEA